jgi:hypothetical protein
MFGQRLRDFRGYDVEVHRILRQSAVPGDRDSVGCERKRNGYVLLEILYRLFVKIIIQNLNTAEKIARSCFGPSGSITNRRCSGSLDNQSPICCLYRRAALRAASFGAGGFKTAFTKTLRASPCKVTNTAAICPWYVNFNTGRTLTFTVHFSASVTTDNLFFVVDEVSNLHGTTDGFQFANPSGSTGVSSGSFTTATAHDFLWGAFNTFPDCGSALTAGTGFTLTAANGDTTALVYKADSGSAGSQSASTRHARQRNPTLWKWRSRRRAPRLCPWIPRTCSTP